MDNTNDKELLDQYLRGELSSVERLNLEKRLATDTFLANQLAELDEVQQGIRLARLASVLGEVQGWEREAVIQQDGFEGQVSEMVRLEKHRELLGEIRGFEEEEEKKVSKTPTSRPYWWKVAASITLLIGVGWFILQSTKIAYHEELFIAYFEPYSFISLGRGEVHASSDGFDIDMEDEDFLEENKLRDRALDLYNSKQYRKAIPLLKKINEEGDPLFLFLYSVALVADKQYDLAIKNLKEFKKEASLLEEKANWYLFLSYLGKGEIEQVKKLGKELEYGKDHLRVKAILNQYK